MSCKVREAIAQVADQGMPTSDDISRRRLLEPAHGIQALLEMPMVAFHSIVEELRRPMLNTGEDCAQSWRIPRGLVRRDPLGPDTSLIDSTSEEAFCGCSIPALREVGVYDLTVLINGTLDVRPLAAQTDVCLIDPPLGTDWMSMGTGSITKEWEEAPNPTIDGTAVNNEPPFGELFDDVGIA